MKNARIVLALALAWMTRPSTAVLSDLCSTETLGYLAASPASLIPSLGWSWASTQTGGSPTKEVFQ